MALVETQALLARLFTDASLQREFFATPLAVAQRFGIEGDEAARLAMLDAREVESFAASLIGKRILDLRKAMPLTARALGARIDRLLTDFAKTPAGKRHRDDAATLTRHLMTLSGSEIAPWIVDIARYEQTFVSAVRPCLIVRGFSYDVASIAAALRAGAEPAPPRRKVFGLWARPKGGRLRFRLLAWPALYARRKASLSSD